MDAQAIDGHTRRDLWDRLEQADYFDWCRKEELKQLRALFFEGKVAESPDDFIRCRQLIWSPLQGEAHWQAAIEARSHFRDSETEELVRSEESGRAFADPFLHDLLSRDSQPYGLAVDDHVALIRFLGFERHAPSQVSLYLGEWIHESEFWLAGEARGEYGIAGLTDMFTSRTIDLFYQLLAQAPLALKGKRLVTTEEHVGWNDDRAARLQSSLHGLFKKIDNYRVPHKLSCDPAPRLRFAESLRHGVEAETTPQVLREVWGLWKSLKTEAQARGQAKAGAPAKTG